MADNKKRVKRKIRVVDQDAYMHKGHTLKYFLKESMGLLTILLTIILTLLGWLSLEYYFSLNIDNESYNETVIEPPTNYETITESHHEYNDDNVGELE